MRSWLGPMLHDASPSELATHLTAGVRNDEVRGGFGLVTSLLPEYDFLIDPLPNLLFTRDSSVWVRDHVTITSLAMPARSRETQLTELIYGEHPRFAGTPMLHGWRNEHVEGGDVLLLAPGVIAIGVGERTTPAGAERAGARGLRGRARPHRARRTRSRRSARPCTSTPCARWSTSTRSSCIPTSPTPSRRTPSRVAAGSGDELVLDVAEAEHFLIAAAKAMGIDTLHQIDTGLDPVTAEREQWDDGNNTLAIAPRIAVAYERNDETNDRLEQSGIEVVRIAGSELGSGRGGPRCMSCPVSRASLDLG